MKTFRITFHPALKPMVSLTITAALFVCTAYFTCSWKDLHATYPVPKIDRPVEPFYRESPSDEANREREMLEREAEDQWIKQYGLDRPTGGFWSMPKEERDPEEQRKVDAIVSEINGYIESRLT